ncbi:putative bifunctional diguanylate cyclase/phosphodiesterase [Marinospirillum alkaliphilum]|uniref:Diguanylate cyclase (GGDEF) domain-containing protein n=1 Tax=Marinospirillum alkaliphilum DSM 21637 TaxID=1122209 RepID=A0A1K1X3M6_9GAMM|nr:EAL domain-containing protein [Marinospirillum alkaliphilum]SFX43669.1 diguanylate cyclase (GGDEF) domain-containing protein [Marinospirillum alkaliphilum DSM 21637]
MAQSDQATLLLVEDAAEIRLLLSVGLGKAGYKVVQAKNGQEGLDAWVEHHPDLVLMDVTMPVMDGFEACRLIREQEVHQVTPILMLTGSDDMASINRAFEVGASDFITKPINLPLLQQRIRYALRDARREKELRHARNLQDSARALAGLAFWEYDPRTDRLHWLDDASRLLHWLSHPPTSLHEALQSVHPEDHARLQTLLRDTIQHGSKFDLELRSLGKEQTYLLKMLGQQDPDTRRIIGAVQDITALRSLEHQAEYLSHHDALTGLPNRKLFLRSLEEQLQATTHRNTLVLVIEVSRLHQISDALGADTADQLLTLLSSQLQHLARNQNGSVARLEGAAFALWLNTSTPIDPDQLRSQLTELLQPLLRQWVIDEHELLLNLTVGISHAPEQADKPADLLRYAQRALRNRRRDGQLTLNLYQPGEVDQLAHRLSLENELRRAVERQEFTLVYQPQLDLASDRVVGVESLLRWNHPEKGQVSPAVFIPLLEELSLIQPLGEWILHHACWQQQQWQQQGYSLRMGINLSPAQFAQSDLLQQIEAAAIKAGVQTSGIKLEITESLAMRDPAASIRLLHDLRDRGFKIAIDDFGIGFSSLEYLLKFPLDSLKIDRAFVKDITRGRSDRAIIKALTSMCQSLGISTIAEGVEDQRQRDYVDALGATEIQGYLISRPLPSDELLAFMSQRQQD